MSPPTAARHVPLSRAYKRLASYIRENGKYTTTGEEGAKLAAYGDNGEIVLEVDRPDAQHHMKFTWSDERQDPHPVSISMEVPPVVHAAVRESHELYLVLLTSSGSEMARFELPPASE